MGSDPILAFYRLEQPDAAGRRLDEIWTWDDQRLEAVHDYIQWLFPLREPSAFNPNAPLLTPDTVRAFAEDATLRERLKQSLALMLGFYGFELSESGAGAVAVRNSQRIDTRRRQWLRPGDHNHLRLSRILASARGLGLPQYSDALLAHLERLYAEHPGMISPTTLGFWRRAGQ